MSTGIAAPSVQDQTHQAQPVADVPWLTVLPLAVVLAFADVFWVGSLRGAVGAIERTQSPFTSWLRESALSVPLFVLAVLGALTLALHRFGPSAHRPRQVAAQPPCWSPGPRPWPGWRCSRPARSTTTDCSCSRT